MKISGQMDSIESATAFRQQFFKDTDANGDGQMTKDELTSMRPARNSGQIMGPVVDEIFARLDANHDGGIDESENLASMQPSETRRQRQPRDASEIARALFERADTDTYGS